MGMIIRNNTVYSGGGGGDNSVELTQAEYDALGDEKLTDGITYYITDADAEGSSSTSSADELSGRNLLKFTATTQTINGVTFTVNDNESVTANGDLESLSEEMTIQLGIVDLVAGTTYKLSGFSQVVENPTVIEIYIGGADVDDTWYYNPDGTESIEFTPIADCKGAAVIFNIVPYDTTSISELVVRPVIQSMSETRLEAVEAEVVGLNESLTVDTTNLSEDFSLNGLLQMLAEKYYPNTVVYELAKSTNWSGNASGNGTMVTVTKSEGSGTYTGTCGDVVRVGANGGTIKYDITDSLTTETQGTVYLNVTDVSDTTNAKDIATIYVGNTNAVGTVEIPSDFYGKEVKVSVKYQLGLEHVFYAYVHELTVTT